MTTTVIIKAHCSDNKEVSVTKNGSPLKILQNGEVGEYYVYDSVIIEVQEVLKKQDEIWDRTRRAWL